MTFTQEKKEQALALAVQGMSWRKVAKVIDVPRSTVSDYLRKVVKDTPQAEDGPNILIFDIETAPSVGYYWRRWKENIGQSQVIQESFLLTWSAKWFGSTETMYDRITTADVAQEDDKAIVESLWNLLDASDIVIAHNGKGFDIPVLNARFAYWGFPPPSSYKLIDTLQIAKKQFRFPSNALDSLGEYLNVGRKIKHSGFDLWRRCMEGDEEAMQEMLAYNIQDVDLLEAVYLKLRAWDKQHPNVSLYYKTPKMRCTCCGSENVEQTGEKVYTSVSIFAEYACGDCGKRMRTGQTLYTDKEVLRNAL